MNKATPPGKLAADGSTGTAADVSLAYDGNGQHTQRTATHNADGSTAIGVRAINAGGSLASATVSITSADGLTWNLDLRRFDPAAKLRQHRHCEELSRPPKPAFGRRRMRRNNPTFPLPNQSWIASRCSQ